MDVPFAPGARVEIRDAEWRIKRIEVAGDGGQLLTCEGLSELVRSREGMFLTRLEQGIRVLEPEATTLVDDTSGGYRASLLYLDTHLRQTPPTDDRIHVAHQAAMDLLPFQLDPARQTLRQPRQRILIADSVGLGKTLEFLQRHMPEDCGLKASPVAVLRGDLRDTELAETVDAFNNPASPVRLLICSDVASEGINLHHLSHRLVHFDIPWSMMVFQQRNGRIDYLAPFFEPERESDYRRAWAFFSEAGG